MLLGLEESVKVPEGGLDELVGGHLFESKEEKDPSNSFVSISQRKNPLVMTMNSVLHITRARRRSCGTLRGPS